MHQIYEKIQKMQVKMMILRKNHIFSPIIISIFPKTDSEEKNFDFFVKKSTISHILSTDYENTDLW